MPQWNPIPGWDVPSNYYAPDESTADEESFKEMIEERLDMQDALVCDGPEKLNQTEQKDHPSNCYCTASIQCHPCMTREVLLRDLGQG